MNSFTTADDNKCHFNQIVLTIELRQAISEMIALSLEAVGLYAYQIKPGAYLMHGLTSWDFKIQDSKLRLPEVVALIDGAFCSDVTLVEIGHRARHHLNVTVTVNLDVAAEGLRQ